MEVPLYSDQGISCLLKDRMFCKTACNWYNPCFHCPSEYSNPVCFSTSTSVQMEKTPMNSKAYYLILLNVECWVIMIGTELLYFNKYKLLWREA